VLSEAQKRAAAVAAERRRTLLQLVREGMSLAQIGRRLGISTQRVAVLLRQVPRGDLEAARATGAGKVRCPHCGLWGDPREAGYPRRR
jgi:transposase-like protein